jgi:dimethylamine/trimethylamine dehydrogenase
MDVASRPNGVGHRFKSRAMDKEDIRTFRRWYRNAALRAGAAGKTAPARSAN